MDSYLVGASGLPADLEQGEVGEALENPIARDRALAPGRRADRHLDQIARVTPDRGGHDRLVGADTPVYDREVAARHGPGGQLVHQIVIGGARLGDGTKAPAVPVVSLA